MNSKTIHAKPKLSKSKLLSLRQCPKRLFLEVHRPELMEESKQSERAFAIGEQVGEIARRLYGPGTLIAPDSMALALEETAQRLEGSTGFPLFEASVEHGGVRVRADVLRKTRRGLELVEVKSAGKVKDLYHADCAIQVWAMKGAGCAPKKVMLAHIDSTFEYQGDGDYRGLLAEADITKPVRELLSEVPGWVRQGKKVLSGKEPKIGIGRHCHDPYECPFLHHCTPPQPKYPVSILPYGGKVVEALRVEGYSDLRKVPAGRLKSDKHVRVWRSSRSGRPEVDAECRSFLRALKYPRYYMDFETISFAVPIWAQTRPFQPLPFQWSCHIESAPSRLSHQGYLSAGTTPPMREFCESLLSAVGRSGPILVYSHFEKRILTEMGERFPDLAGKLNRVIRRLVDLLPVMRRHYYHPAMMGSWKIKDVLPTLARELAYGDLEVRDGGMAQEAFAEILTPRTSKMRRMELRRALEAYCERDTMAMVAIARGLSKTRGSIEL